VSTAPANDRRFPAEKEDAIVKWALDPSHSTTNFAIRHMMSKVRGTISVKEGWIDADEAEDPSSASVEVVLDAASVHTGVAPRDADLRSPNFFEVEKYPTITFRSKRIEGNDPKHFVITGDLTMHGVTKSITFPLLGGRTAEFPKGMQRTGFSTELVLKRAEFGIDKFPDMLGDDVHISISFEGTRK
jgi:polyisoprenoid-binding protein YceI